jgi:uncharacterized membrane protein (UPF0127 family)
MNGLCFFAMVLAVALCAGCDDSGAPASVAGFDPGEPTQAQPPLQTMKLYIGPQELVAELALTPQQQRAGMMFRTNMAENAGMIFPLPFTQQAGFWMKNCPYPLSAAYIDEEGVIQEIHDLQPHDTNTVAAARANIRFVLETNKGWFERHHITTNVVVATERGSLMATFFGKR